MTDQANMTERANITERANMTDQAKRQKAAAQRAALVKLVRQLLQGECVVEKGEGGELWLVSASGPPESKSTGRRCHTEATLRQVQSLGLAQRNGGRIAATGSAAAFLRRALVDHDESFAAQHREIGEAHRDIEGTRQAVRLNLSESPLGIVARLKDRNGEPFLTIAAIEAGERLLSDFTRAQMQPRITASWEPRLSGHGKGQPGGKLDITESAMEAQRRFSAAMEGMGPELSGVAVDICCFGKGLELVERERQWPARSAKLMLRTALMALSRHYDPPRPQPRRKNHHWGSDGYRPLL